MLNRYNPYKQYLKHEELLAPFDALISDFLNNTGFKNIPQDFMQKGTYPKCNIYEEKDKLYIEAGVPGLKKEDIDIEITDNVLSIKFKSTASKKNYLVKELKQSASRRSFFLNEDFDTETITAVVKDGLLVVSISRHIPKEKQSKTKRIAIT